MTFIKRLFGQKPLDVLPMRGGVLPQQPEQEYATARAARKIMEAQVDADRARRGATDIRPSDPIK